MKLSTTFSKKIKSIIGGELSKAHWAVLGLGLLAAFLFAFWPLYSQVNFYYDQARDAYEAYSIWHNFDIKVIGPATDIPGLYHGALWFYFLAPLYFIGQGSFDIAATLFFLLSWLTLPLVWLLAKELSKNPKVATATVILYAFSPLFQLSSRWVSNPTLGLMLMPIVMYSMWMYLKSAKSKYAVVLGISTALVIHANLGYALVLLTAPLFWFLREKRSWKSLIPLFMSFGVVMSPFALAEVKFHGRGIQAFVEFIVHRKGSNSSIIGILELTLKKWNELFKYSFVTLPMIVTTILLLVLIGLIFAPQLKKIRREVLFLFVWIVNLLLFQFFNTGISTSVFVHFPYVIAAMLLVVMILGRFVKNKFALAAIMIVLMVFQIQKSMELIAESRNPLTVQIGATYENVKKVINYTYKNTDTPMFTVNTITSPLFINTTWAYAYNFYGQKQYGFLPYWDGRDQAGLLGSMPVRDGQKHVLGETRYLIIEPTTGIPEYFMNQIMGEENSWSELVSEEMIGNFKIQKRKYIESSTNLH